METLKGEEAAAVAEASATAFINLFSCWVMRDVGWRGPVEAVVKEKVAGVDAESCEVVDNGDDFDGKVELDGSLLPVASVVEAAQCWVDALGTCSNCSVNTPRDGCWVEMTTLGTAELDTE